MKYPLTVILYLFKVFGEEPKYTYNYILTNLKVQQRKSIQEKYFYAEIFAAITKRAQLRISLQNNESTTHVSKRCSY